MFNLCILWLSWLLRNYNLAIFHNPKLQSTQSVNINKKYAVNSRISVGIQFLMLINHAFVHHFSSKSSKSRHSNHKKSDKRTNLQQMLYLGGALPPAPLLASVLKIWQLFAGSKKDHASKDASKQVSFTVNRWRILRIVANDAFCK